MPFFKPTLSVRHLSVYRRGRTVFDIEFHDGFNIIRGENSSGKSTILDFLFFALGGDLTDWREAALLCDEVWAEVSLNGRIATLAREVSQSGGRPMRIFAGSTEEAKETREGWAIFPYKRSSQKESFSQVLFRWLEMPEVVGDSSSNITIHQILRVIYSDQVTPIDKIFRQENFDTALVRQTIGDLLCGAFDDNLYRSQMRRRDVNKELDAATNELKSIFQVIGQTRHSLTLEWIASERAVIHQRMENVQTEIGTLEEKIFHGEVSDGLSLEEQQQTYTEVRFAQEELSRLRSEIDDLELEIADSDRYMAGLRSKLSALNDASVAANVLKGISFLYCPACFAPLDVVDSDHHCGLCKAPFDRDRSQSRVLLLINDLSMQLKQSEQIQSSRKDELASLDQEIAKATERWELANKRYTLANRVPSTELRTKSKLLHREVGYLERQLEDLNERAALIERIDRLSAKKAKLTAELSRLDDMIRAGEAAQRVQLQKAYTAIADNMRALLKRDLSRQDTFEKADRIEFSFGDDRLSVNGERFFSASSMVYMRNSFFVAFWQASLGDKNFRHPRLIIMDTVEDKGMEPERSHNFQRIIADISESCSLPHQIIIATSMIAPEFEETKYVTGRFFRHDDRTLNFPVGI